MEIRKSLLEVLGGKRICLSKYTVAKEKTFEDSPLRNVLTIRLDAFPNKKCELCDKNRFDFCWNCEKPFCDDHMFIIMPLSHNIMNCVCEECKKEIEKLSKQ
jgi:hypothetical protein